MSSRPEPSPIRKQSRPGSSILRDVEAAFLAGRSEEAEASVRALLDDEPANADAHALLARLHLAQGRTEEAVASYVRCVGLRPESAWGWKGLGMALGAARRWNEAARALREATRLADHDAETWSSLGHALVRDGRTAEAPRALRRAISIAPNVAEYHDVLGAVLRALGKRGPGRRAFARAAQLAPGLARAHFHLGVACAEDGLATEGLEHVRRALELEPDRPAWWTERARVALLAQDVPAGREAALRAVELAPRDAAALGVLARVERAEGREDRAQAFFVRALAVDEAATRPVYELARAGRLEDLAPIERRLSRGGLAYREHADLAFALAWLHDRRRESRRALDRLAEGHAVLRRAGQGAYDRVAARAHTRDVLAVASDAGFAARADLGDPSELPVLLVGLPGAGLELVEQALAAHAQVHALGAHDGLSRAARLLPAATGRGRPYPSGLPDVDGAAAVRLARAYLASLPDRARAAERAIDRGSALAFHLPLAGAILRNARVVRVRRNSFDAALATYFEHPPEPAPGFTHDLGELLSHGREHERLVDAIWEALPLRKIELDYEELVRRPGGVLRELVAFLELPWQDECVAFHGAGGGTMRPLESAATRRQRYAALLELDA